jgi:hypothetical protein
MQPLKLISKYINLIQDYLSGISLTEIATKHNLPIEEVSEILNSKEVSNFITTYLKNYSFLNPLKRVNILEQLIQNKIQDGISTKKDLLDIIKLLQDEYKLIDKTQEITNNNYINIVKDILEQ